MIQAKELVDVAENTINGAICAVYLLLDDEGNDQYLVAYKEESELLCDYADVLLHIANKGYEL